MSGFLSGRTSLTTVQIGDIAAGVLLYSGVKGMDLTTDTDTDHDINVTAGRGFDATGVEEIILASEITKQLDAAWAVGDDAGGLDTGGIAATTGYYVWLIKRSDTDVVDVLFSLSGTAPTMPANYDYKRIIGYILTDSSSNLTPFFQQGNYFEYTPANDQVKNINDSTITSLTYEDAAIPSPRNSWTHIRVECQNESSTDAIGNQVMIRHTAGPSDVSTSDHWFNLETASDSDQMYMNGFIYVDGSSQISYGARENSGTVRVAVQTIGFLCHNREVLG